MLKRYRWRLEDWCWTLHETLERWFQSLWACRRGDHRMKMSGCMYCGAGGSEQPKYYVTWR